MKIAGGMELIDERRMIEQFRQRFFGRFQPSQSKQSPGSGIEPAHPSAVVEKNLRYFHHWRPQNITYLFLFRKHEQGNNAVEIPQFDPLIEKQEQLIAQLKRPPACVCELVRVEE